MATHADGPIFCSALQSAEDRLNVASLSAQGSQCGCTSGCIGSGPGAGYSQLHSSGSVSTPAFLSVPSVFSVVLSFPALVEHFVQEDTRGDGEVERVTRAHHRDFHHAVTQRLHLPGQAFALPAHEQHNG